jgi:hypothetical protein
MESKEKYACRIELPAARVEIIRGAARPRHTITYKQLCERINQQGGDMPTQGSHLQHEVGQLLSEMLEEDLAKGWPLLCILVVSKKTGKPSWGFCEWARQKGVPIPADEQAEARFIAAETRLVYAFWGVSTRETVPERA